jgi:CDP-paratose 2-epimerase
MAVAIITGSAGLIGSESATFFHSKGFEVAGIDNDMRRDFFGPEASTAWKSKQLQKELANYRHFSSDIRDAAAINSIFQRFGNNTRLVIHAAAQPSHDWAAGDPLTDFSVNATGTLVLLEATRRFCPDAVFIFVSTNKVYGDTPNKLPLVENDSRWELSPSHAYAAHGIDESMSIDTTMHSVFGASKCAADIMAQEYGRYFGLRTAVFRGGCLTGPAHSAAEQHGFLAYLVKCAIIQRNYTIYGYKGKQVRDNIHAADLISAFWNFFENPRAGEVYNIGGSRHSNCSILEAIEMIEKLTGRAVRYSVSEQARSGDHIWWITDVRKFRAHYPSWDYRYDIAKILEESVDEMRRRARATAST